MEFDTPTAIGEYIMSVKKKILVIVSVTLIIVIASLVGIGIYSVNTFGQSERIASNITFNGVYIGDLTKEDALTLLKSKSFPADLPVKVTYNDKSFEFAPNASGINYNFDAALDYAYSKGRSGNFFNDLIFIIKSRFSYTAVPNSYEYNEEVFSDTITTLLQTAQIEFNNFDIKVYENYASVKIGSDLTQVDFEKLYSDTIKIIDQKENRTLTLPTVKIGKPTAEMIYDKIYVEPINASTKTENGITTVTPHTIGVIVDIADIEKALNEEKTSFTIPVTKKYPEVRVENLSGELFSDVLGSYTSKYNPSLIGRTQNVTLSAKKINGVILNSGDIFSYNRTVGPRSAATGFSTATIYTKEGLSEEMGGGICQVSSTLYNAVLYADLKIVERQNHMYTVGYVRNGLDATVVYGLIDFRFENNLKSPIQIVTSVGGGVLTVTILGKKENNNKVELYTNTLESYPFETKHTKNNNLAPGSEKVTQNGSYGYKINATKVVKDSNGNVIRQEFLGTDVYKPLTKIVEQGPPAPMEDQLVSTEEGSLEKEPSAEGIPPEEVNSESKPEPSQNQPADLNGEESQPEDTKPYEDGAKEEAGGEQTAGSEAIPDNIN